MAVKFDPILNKLRQKDIIPQLDADPASPKSQESWVLRTGVGGVAGQYQAMLGLGFPYLSSASGGVTYQLSYRTKEGTTKRTTLS